jgi:rhodanese-related sulfurtransferase
VFDLEEMELTYPPQYGSAKDPINMAGFVAGGLLRGEHPQVDVEVVLAALADRRPFVVDVRTPQEFAAGHMPGAMNVFLAYRCPCGAADVFVDVLPQDGEFAEDFDRRKAAMEEAIRRLPAGGVHARVVPVNAP